jgi:hypothetical protein
MVASRHPPPGIVAAAGLDTAFARNAAIAPVYQGLGD